MAAGARGTGTFRSREMPGTEPRPVRRRDGSARERRQSVTPGDGAAAGHWADAVPAASPGGAGTPVSRRTGCTGRRRRRLPRRLVIWVSSCSDFFREAASSSFSMSSFETLTAGLFFSASVSSAAIFFSFSVRSSSVLGVPPP